MKQKNIVLLPAVLATGMMSFAGVLIETAMNVTFPTLISEFGLATSDVQWVTTIYLLVISIMVPFSNHLIKNHSIRRLFIVANLFFIGGLLTDFLAPNFLTLLGGRLLQGISTGIALPLMFHIILSFSPMEKRGTMMGLGTLTTSIAPAIGPTYGGWLTSALSWHYIFLLLVPVLLLSLATGLYAIGNITVKRSSRIDSLSLFTLALSFSGWLVFLNQFNLIALLCGIGGLGLFLWRNQTTEVPLVSLKILKNRSFTLFLAVFLVCQFLLLGISFVLPNFVQIVLKENAFVAGLVMLPGAAIGAIVAPISGRVLDRYGAKFPILFGLSLAVVGWTGLILALARPSLLAFVCGHTLYSFGLGFAYSNMMTSGMNLLSQKDYGDGNTLYNTLQQFSGAVATSMTASIIGSFQQADSNYQKGTVLGSQVAMGALLAMLLIVSGACLIHFNKTRT